MSDSAKILVVDDSISMRVSIQKTLSQFYEVQTAESGEAALERLKSFVPDIVLLDVTMEGMDGYSVCRKIRYNDALGFIKIIIISSRTGLPERLKGYEAGADDYIPKPFQEEELLAKVGVFLRLKSVEDELQRLNNSLQEQVKIRSEQLIGAERLAAVGRHSAGIVHNLNTPLQAIMGTAELLAIKNPDNAHIMRLRKAAAQMKQIIGAILSAGSRALETECTPVDLNAILRDQIELLCSDLFFKHQIKKHIDLGPLPPYMGISTHFSQIFSNLIKNASDAMFHFNGGELTISSRVENHNICFIIADTGHGIAQENLNKIFNPFYTTKSLTPKDKEPGGTGLGLASAREMIESYGGRIEVASEEGKGATVTVWLPLD